jgi:probable HAF family extracellular repeat protein
VKSRALMWSTAITLFAAPAISVPLGAQEPKKDTQYKFVDLGTFGGPNSFLDCCGIILPVLNNQGVVVGGADTSAPNPNPAFKWRDGVLTNLGALPGGYNSFAASVNARGDVVGTAENG